APVAAPAATETPWVGRCQGALPLAPVSAVSAQGWPRGVGPAAPWPGSPPHSDIQDQQRRCHCSVQWRSYRAWLVLFLTLAPFGVVFAGTFEAAFNQVHVLLRCGNAALGLLLKAMQNIDGMSKLHRIHGTVGIPVVIVYDFQDPCPTKAFEGLGVGMLLSLLGKVEGIAHDILYLIGKHLQVHLRRSHPKQRFSCCCHPMPLLA